MFTKFRNSYHNASQWAHHHSAVFVLGLTLCAGLFGSLYGASQTFAATLDCSTASNINVPVIECQALLDLYTDTDGANRYNNAGRDTDTDVCDWYGVDCNGNNVSSIDLADNNLVGEVPQTIGNMPYLYNLLLDRNQNLYFNVEIVQGLTGLNWLSATNTIVQGDIDMLSGLVNIAGLFLSCRDTHDLCDVTGNLDFIANMTGLYNLSIDGLGIDGTLDPLYDKFNLSYLDIDGNNITGSIDNAFGNLTGLIDIEMTNNQLTGPIPSTIGNLVNATERSINNNLLDGQIPQEIGSMINLQTLNLNHNLLDGQIPQEIGSMINIQTLNLNNNQLTGPIPSSIGNLTSLQTLSLDNNQLDGQIPTSLENLSNLITLNLARNLFDGSFDVDMSTWQYLETLWLGDNNTLVVDINNFATLGSSVKNITIDNTIITGDISNLSGLYGLTDLNMACLSGDAIDMCNIDGQLNTLYNLTSMQNIQIGGVNLAGTLQGISNLSQLMTINLESNQLSGQANTELNTLPNLVSVNITNNNLSGPLPTFASALGIREIYLEGNYREGSLPSEWGNLSNLTTIVVGGKGLNGRYLNGDLPSSWGDLIGLQRLDISFTSISGAFPDSRSNLTNLNWFNMFYNEITGPIPDGYSGFLTNNTLERFWINNNHIDGDIPEWFQDIGYQGKIEANCLNTDNISEGLSANLDQNFGVWNTQSNCLPDVRISSRIDHTGPIVPGSIIDYYINYENIGQQKASHLIISQKFPDYITIYEDYSSGAEGLIKADYFGNEDMCYTDMMYQGIGSYADYFASILGGYAGLGTGLNLNQVGEGIFNQGDFPISTQIIRDVVADQSLSTGGSIVTFFCFFASNITASLEPNQPVVMDFYENLGSQCLVPLFGIDPRDIGDETCGANQVYGYNWNIGTLAAGTSGTIHMKLQISSNATPGTTLENQAYLQMDGNNQNPGGNEDLFTILVVSPTNPNPPSPGPSGGNPPALQTDDCSNYTPPVDSSSSYYDAKCEKEIKKQEENKVTEKPQFNKKDVLPTTQDILDELAKLPAGLNVDAERVEAYLMAKNIGMTTMPDFMAFQPGVEITRAAAAKYFVQYIETVLGKTADESRRSMCSKFDDTDKLKGEDLHEFVIRACMHKLMGLEQGVNILPSFRPYDNLPRTEGATMVSRLLYGTEYDNTDNQYTTRYEGHIQKLLTDKIITDGNPNLIEKRVYPLLMFLRWIKSE